MEIYACSTFSDKLRLNYYEGKNKHDNLHSVRVQCIFDRSLLYRGPDNADIPLRSKLNKSTSEIHMKKYVKSARFDVITLNFHPSFSLMNGT